MAATELLSRAERRAIDGPEKNVADNQWPSSFKSRRLQYRAKEASLIKDKVKSNI